MRKCYQLKRPLLSLSQPRSFTAKRKKSLWLKLFPIFVSVMTMFLRLTLVCGKKLLCLTDLARSSDNFEYQSDRTLPEFRTG